MPLNVRNQVYAASNTNDIDQAQAIASHDSASTSITPGLVAHSQEVAADLMVELDRMSDVPTPWSGGNRAARDNWQSTLALAGVLKQLLDVRIGRSAETGSAITLSDARDPRLSDYAKEFGTRGLQLLTDVGLGFAAHQIFNEVLPKHNLVGQSHTAQSPSSSSNSSSTSEPTDVGNLFAKSSGLGFAAPAFVSGSAAFVAGHLVNSLINAPRTVTSDESSTAKRIAHEQVQNFLFNMPGMIGGFTAANLVLSALDASGKNNPGLEWLLWSLGGGLGGAIGGTLTMAYKTHVMGQKVADVNRDWDGKMHDLKNLDFKSWIKFIPAHCVSLTPIQYQGTASSALIPGNNYNDVLGRRSANTAVLQTGFWASHGNVQKLCDKAIGLLENFGMFCNDKIHICSPKTDPNSASIQINEFLRTSSNDLKELAQDLDSLLRVSNSNPSLFGVSNEFLQKIQDSLITLSKLHVSPPSTNESGTPTTRDDVSRWYGEAQRDLRDNLRNLQHAFRETFV